MQCPSCNQIASSFSRFSFSMQGVSFAQSMKGYFRCQNCGALLRVGSFTREMWILQVLVVAALVAFVLFYQRLMDAWGTGVLTLIWLLLIIFVMSVFTFGLWKFGRAAIVETQAGKKNSPANH